MTRRNQSRRRRSYGRRQHEVRERRPQAAGDPGWLSADSFDAVDDTWQATDLTGDQGPYGAYSDGYGTFAR